MAVAQPMPVAVAVAQPVMAQPVGQVPVQVVAASAGPAGNFTRDVGYTPPQPKQRWVSELCECCNGGCGMCCAVWCCPFITYSQIYTKVMGKHGQCMGLTLGMFLLWLVYQILSQAGQNMRGGFGGNGDAPGLGQMLTIIGEVVWLVFVVLSTYLVMTARKRIREKDNIPAECCGECNDCCCSFWCQCCTTIQMFNQVEVNCQTGYQLCDQEAGIPVGASPGI